MSSEPPPKKRALLLVSLFVFTLSLKISLLFFGSHYREHLFSDMEWFWFRANARYDGAIFDISQWWAVPPFFHLFIFQLFKIDAFFGFYDRRLELTHLVFIFLSTFSVMGIYQIAKQMTERFWIAFLTAAFYAFCYPVVYFNTFFYQKILGSLF